jgi:hypothetical protein
MKRNRWSLILAITLLGISALAYLAQIAVFHDARNTIFYMLQDIAFVPIQVLLVTMIVNELLTRREKLEMQNKLNMVIGAFFSELAVRFTDWLGVRAPSGLLLRDGFQLVAIFVTVLLLYRFVPARKLRRRGAIAGAILTAVGIWGATKVLAIIFADYSRYNLIYGSLAGVMTFLFFVYVVAWILLLGAEFAYAWSQPAGPPGPPVRAQLVGVVRGLFVHQADGRESPTEEPARRP